MIKQLAPLNGAEVQQLTDVIPLITLLIAGADGKIEDKELDWARKVANIRTYASDEHLRSFYELAETNFDERFSHYHESLSSNIEVRNEQISAYLAEVNHILPKIDQHYAYRIYKSFRSFATQVGKASGGFMSFFSISKHESRWLPLAMITPVLQPEGEEEE